MWPLPDAIISMSQVGATSTSSPDGGVGTSGNIVAAIASGADAVMLGTTLARASEAPGGGWHWGPEAHHPHLPRGNRVHVGVAGSLEQVLSGPAESAEGVTNLMGALRHSMATCGYTELKEFQRVDVVVPTLNTHVS